MKDALSEAFLHLSECYDKILEADLENNSFRLLSGNYDREINEPEGVLSAFWEKEFNKDNLFPADKSGVEKFANLTFIRDFFDKYQGREKYWLRYRKLVGNEYQPFRVEIFPGREYSKKNQKVYLFFRNLSGILYQQSSYIEELLRSLSENYEGVFFVDFDKDVIIPYRMPSYIDEKFGEFFRSGVSYENALTEYVKQCVEQKDLQEMLEIAKTEYIRSRLLGKKAYSHEYHVVRNGEEQLFRFKISNVDGIGELNHAVVGFANITSEKQAAPQFFKATRKLLIVEPEEKVQRELTQILAKCGNLVMATNGNEALDVLEQFHEEISVALIELKMTDMDGYELIKRMKKDRRYRDIPIVVVSVRRSTDQDGETEVACLELGASDYVKKPFIPNVVVSRVRSLIRLRESMAMLNILEKDPLTGLYTKAFFFKKVEDYLTEHPNNDYLMWVSDIQGLKVINEKYGLEKGDAVLQIMAGHGVKHTPGFLFGGRIEGDKFAALMRNMDKEVMEVIVERNDSQMTLPVPNVVIKHGIYHIDRRLNVTPQGMYDRAMLALQKIKSRYGVYLAEYNDELRKDILLKQMILGTADDALEQGQFQVYFQPKHDFHTNTTCGAEGLVRWLHPDIGFMNPGLFISLFEQNGFITKLDFYVWEEVCRTIKKWENDGVPVVPVSINVSRRDFERPDLAGEIISLIDRYGIAHEMVHVEVTESAYSDDPEKITGTVRKLHENGFVIELDDFGTGYSSLIALSSMDLDILKLDQSIIQNDIPGSDKNILEFSMQLAKMLKLKTVAEGVETKEQMERVSALGGDYIQGYYYSKPLPADDFDEYLLQKNGKQN